MAVGFVALGGAFFADGWVGVGHGDASGEGVAVLCCALVGLRLSCAKGGGCPIARKQEKAVKLRPPNQITRLFLKVGVAHVGVRDAAFVGSLDNPGSGGVTRGAAM
jgi:hypothetical protein